MRDYCYLLVLTRAIVSFVGLVLNSISWGIGLEPIIASLTLYVILLVFTGSYRKSIEKYSLVLLWFILVEESF